MRPLSPQDILAVWERGAHQGALERALALLARACPEVGIAQLAGLPLDERDHLLLELRVLTFGARLEAVARCPHCGEWLEFELPAAELLATPTSLELGDALDVVVEGVTVHVRVPTSEDLLAARKGAGESTLLARCVAGDESLRRAAFDRLADARPNLEVMIGLACTECGQPWQERFDPGEYLWTEVRAQARRLLLDIHVLASTYGWPEHEVLAMTTTRRHAYLAMVGS